MKRKISILGATGSVGTSTLDLIERAPERFEALMTLRDEVRVRLHLAGMEARRRARPSMTTSS